MSAHSLAVYLKSLRDQRRGILWWSIGIAAYVALYVSFYPQYRDNPDLARPVQDLPEGVAAVFSISDNITAPSGFLQSTVYGTLMPFLVIFCGVWLGSRAIAGDEENGSLDLLLAHPVSRRRLVVERFGAMATVVFWLGFIILALVAVFNAALDMNLSADKLVAVNLGLALLALCFGALSLAIGAATGQRSLVLGLTSGAAVGAYLVNALSSQITALRPLRWISPFHYFLGRDPLETGFAWGYIAVLIVIPLLLLMISLITFDRRDLNV